MSVEQPSDAADTIGIALAEREDELMNILLIIVAVVAVILLLTGGLVHTLSTLLYIGAVLLVIAVIVWLVRFITGRRSV